MNFVRIGNRVINLANVLYCEHQVFGDEENVKVHLAGSANNTPLVLCGKDAKQMWKHLDGLVGEPA